MSTVDVVTVTEEQMARHLCNLALADLGNKKPFQVTPYNRYRGLVGYVETSHTEYQKLTKKRWPWYQKIMGLAAQMERTIANLWSIQAKQHNLEEGQSTDLLYELLAKTAATQMRKHTKEYLRSMKTPHTMRGVRKPPVFRF